MIILWRKNFVLNTTLLYSIGGCAWIVMSDRLLAQIFDRNTFVSLSSYKGLVFIAFTSVLLFIALRRAVLFGAVKEPETRARGGATPIILTAAGISILIVASAMWGYRVLSASIAENALDHARAVVDIRAGDLGRWLEAQKTNAVLLGADDKVLALADHASLRGGDREALQRDLRAKATAFGFSDANLVDVSGHSQLSIGDAPIEPIVAATAKKSFATGEPTLVDLHLDAKGGRSRLGYIVLVVAPPGAKNPELAIYAELDARDFFQPFMGAWPFQRAKGAGLLARREGDDIVLLIGLSDDDGAFKSLRQPYATSPLRAAAFMRDEAHAIQGIGWNGAPIVAAGQKVPGTDWELVAWIDKADALAGLKNVALMAGLLAALGVAASWIIAGYLWQNQRLVGAQAVRRSRASFEQAPIAMAHVSLNGRLLRVNQRLCEILGYSQDELLAMDVVRLSTPERRPESIRQLARVRAGTIEEYSCERQFIRKDGSVIDVALSVVLVRGEAGEPDYLMSVFEDITLRKGQEATLRLAAVVYTSTREGVVVTDVDENILMVNPAFERITGYDEAAMLGKTMRIVQSGRHGRDFYQTMWRGIKEKGYFCGEIWNKRKNGEIYPQLATISAVFGPSGMITNYIGVFSDIGQLKESETRLEFFAHHDPLTLFPNRLLLRLRIEHAIRRARSAGAIVAVLVLDLDRFKTVNDSLGHTAGDQLLVDAAGRWSKKLGASDTLARVGADEFVVLLEEIPESHAAAVLAQNLIDSTAAHFVLPGGREAFVGLSVGISLFPDNGEDAEALIQHAGSALDLAKRSGGSTVRFYSDAMTKEANSRLELESGMRRGLERGEFVLQFQPLVSLVDGRIVGVEALTRWRSPSGLIPPDKFIPLAEETGLIVPLGDWVLREACGRMKAWRDAGAEIGVVAVNLSPIQLDRPDICDRIHAILEETGLPPHCLEIEITESALLEQQGDAEAKLAALKALGLRISIDDFGAGHSSLFYLKRFPIDKLKLDRSFIIDIPGDPTSMEIAAAIVHLAHSLKVDALAEGVETEAQAEFLKACGCKLAQGYLFDKPLWERELLAKYGVTREAVRILAG